VIPDVLTCGVVALGVWTFLRLISNERERLETEISAAVAAMPSPPPADTTVPISEIKPPAGTKPSSATKPTAPLKPPAR
jgi:hypothetical protein